MRSEVFPTVTNLTVFCWAMTSCSLVRYRLFQGLSLSQAIYIYSNVLGYWRRRSICYTCLFTTSLVVTTISFYNVLGPSDVVSRSGPGSCALTIGSSLMCISGRSFDHSSVIFFRDLSSVFSLLCVLSLSLRFYSLLPLEKGVGAPERIPLVAGFHFPC
jgi:hypothetical protein